MKTYITALLISLAASTASASELVYHLGTWHSQRTYVENYERKSYTEVNFGVGYVSDEGWTGGAYRNSYGEFSAYGGKTWTWQLGRMDAVVSAVLATGYQDRSNMVLTPLISAGVKAPITEQLSVLVNVVPVVFRNSGDSKLGAILHVGITQKF